MYSELVVILFCPLVLALVSTLQDAGRQTNHAPVDLRLPANFSNDETSIQFNASNKIRIQCDGEKYGFNPNVPDCQDARSYFKRSSVLFRYGERHSGLGPDVFPLPYRLMGGTLSGFS